MINGSTQGNSFPSGCILEFHNFVLAYAIDAQINLLMEEVKKNQLEIIQLSSTHRSQYIAKCGRDIQSITMQDELKKIFESLRNIELRIIDLQIKFNRNKCGDPSDLESIYLSNWHLLNVVRENSPNLEQVLFSKQNEKFE